MVSSEAEAPLPLPPPPRKCGFPHVPLLQYYILKLLNSLLLLIRSIAKCCSNSLYLQEASKNVGLL